MIVKYGMDPDLGTISYADRPGEEYAMYKPYSDQTAQLIDKKVQHYLAECYAKSKQLISQNKSLIEHLSVTLLDKEYLSKDEFETMVNTFETPKKPLKK